MRKRLSEEYLYVAKIGEQNEDGTVDLRVYPVGSSNLDLTDGGKYLTVHTITPLFKSQGGFIG